jgi:hypothetical protein
MTRGGILSAADDGDEDVIGAISTMRRSFTDSTGVEWAIVESPPRVLTLIRPRERRGEPRLLAGVVGAARFATRDLGAPCLHFEASHERRQLTPIPTGWEEMRVDELEELLSASSLMPEA